MNYLGSYFKGDCLRKIALVGLNEITKLSEIEALVKSNANAILFIVPKGPYQKIFNDLVSKIQVFLSQQTIYLPVYFAYENDELKSLYNEATIQFLHKETTQRTMNLRRVEMYGGTTNSPLPDANFAGRVS